MAATVASPLNNRKNSEVSSIRNNFLYHEDREVRVAEIQSYKKMMIDDILKMQTRGQFTREYLEKKSIRALESIYDNVD